MVAIRYSLFIVLILILILSVDNLVEDKSAYDLDPYQPENMTNDSLGPASGQNSLMSTPDDTSDDTGGEEKRGWWKHEGHSTVSTGGTKTTEPSDGKDEGGSENEIPEFPNVAIPMVAVLVLALSFRRK